MKQHSAKIEPKDEITPTTKPKHHQSRTEKSKAMQLSTLPWDKNVSHEWTHTKAVIVININEYRKHLRIIALN